MQQTKYIASAIACALLLVIGCDSMETGSGPKVTLPPPGETPESEPVRNSLLLEWQGYSTGFVEMTSLGWLRHDFRDGKGLISTPIDPSFQDSVLAGFELVNQVEFSSSCSATSQITVHFLMEGRTVVKPGPRCGIDESDSLQVIVNESWERVLEYAYASRKR